MAVFSGERCQLFLKPLPLPSFVLWGQDCKGLTLPVPRSQADTRRINMAGFWSTQLHFFSANSCEHGQLDCRGTIVIESGRGF